MPIKNKTKDIKSMVPVIEELKKKGKTVVQCHGVFDLLHPGHIRHLQEAKKQGDILVVTITPDRFVNKGPGRPVFSELLRQETLASLEYVDYACINTWPTATHAIELLKPDVYVKGIEYAKREDDVTGKIYEEEEAVLNVGGRIHFTEDITFSSSSLINAFMNVFPEKTEKWLAEFRQRYSVDDVTGYLDKLKSMKVLVIGEAIIDEYVFCNGLGKSNKDPILAFKYNHTERYAGGSLAVANHFAGFCDNVGIVTLAGEKDDQGVFMKQNLKGNVKSYILKHTHAPSLCKRRFVDSHTKARMFELYMMEDSLLKSDEDALADTINGIIDNYDLVCITDYGHGMMTSALVNIVCKRARFLAVNTQANAGNRGFNTISKYPRADYVCLAGHEVALETRMRNAKYTELILEVIKKIKCDKFTMTSGKDGSIHYDKDGFVKVPALATKVVDRVGAGDAVLAMTSMLVCLGAPWEVTGLLGNAAGAQLVGMLGNKASLEKVPLIKHITAILK